MLDSKYSNTKFFTCLSMTLPTMHRREMGRKLSNILRSPDFQIGITDIQASLISLGKTPVFREVLQISRKISGSAICSNIFVCTLFLIIQIVLVLGKSRHASTILQLGPCRGTHFRKLANLTQ